MSQEQLNNQGLNNQGHLPFRPLDNSMSTQTKYELEAQHWYNAQKAVNSRNTTVGVGGFFTLLGAIFNIIGGILSFFFYGVIILADLYKRWRIERDHDNEHRRYMERLDKVIAVSPKVKGYDTPDSEYEKD